MIGMVIAIPDVDRHPAVFAFSISWVIGGFVGAVTQKTLLQINSDRFHFARWERNGEVYRWVGVEAFCWILRRTPIGWLNPALKLNARKSGIENLLRQINFAEGAHIIGGAITLGCFIGYAFTGHVGVAGSFAVVTVLFHAYPIMVQRRNRGRIMRVIQRIAPPLCNRPTA